MKKKVIYFTVNNLGVKNGGALCCRNHIQRLNSDDAIELFVILTGPPEWETNSISFLKNHNVAGNFIPFKKSDRQPLKDLIFKKTSFHWGRIATEQRQHLDQAILNAIQENSAQFLLIDFLYSVLFCPKSINTIPKKILITHNRETEIYRDTLNRLSNTLSAKLLNRLKLARMWHFEQSTLRNMDKIIALSPPDVPAHKGIYISSYFDKKPKQWKSNSSRTIFFVGDINNYPNVEAISYITTQLAPLLIKLLPDVRIKIIGASSNDAVACHPAVDLLGKSDLSELEYYFLNCQLFICPIKNTFGMKFKMIEALSYGTPILASPETLLGFPYLKNQPSLSLTDPIEAAKTIAAIMQNEKTTKKLAESMQIQQSHFIESQKNIWSRSLESI